MPSSFSHDCAEPKVDALPHRVAQSRNIGQKMNSLLLQLPVAERVIASFVLDQRFTVCALVCHLWRNIVRSQYRYPMTWRFVVKRLQDWFWRKKAMRDQNSIHVARVIDIGYTGIARTVNSMYMYFPQGEKQAQMPVENVGAVYAFGAPKSNGSELANSATFFQLHIWRTEKGKSMHWQFAPGRFEYVESVSHEPRILGTGSGLPAHLFDLRLEVDKQCPFEAGKYGLYGWTLTQFIHYGHRQPWTIDRHDASSESVIRIDFYCYALTTACTERKNAFLNDDLFGVCT